ncbi:hypothetical protein [Phytoactinopolyspora mesophila]|uniref:Uncharacterized protein n=1 Tax=Phytoactinopolyspora mesophila TaxID=2650750 RepID=A0A7K3M9J1_9ACTN|nr:hypothetical protein [Phytoactinopolyspora mesophila]NDL59936.1 hypothetical protein [Phytoactinopolyspora mesophila]
MAIPFVQECNESMSGVYTAAREIREAIDAVAELATDETWEGKSAEEWMTELEGLTGDVLRALGDPLSEAIEECRNNAQRMEQESAGV